MDQKGSTWITQDQALQKFHIVLSNYEYEGVPQKMEKHFAPTVTGPCIYSFEKVARVQVVNMNSEKSKVL